MYICLLSWYTIEFNIFLDQNCTVDKNNFCPLWRFFDNFHIFDLILHTPLLQCSSTNCRCLKVFLFMYVYINVYWFCIKLKCLFLIITLMLNVSGYKLCISFESWQWFSMSSISTFRSTCVWQYDNNIVIKTKEELLLDQHLSQMLRYLTDEVLFIIVLTTQWAEH